MVLTCKSCGANPEALVCLQYSVDKSVTSINLSYGDEFSSQESLFWDCSSCNETGTLVTIGNITKCLWCDSELDPEYCIRCNTPLTPYDCSYCSYTANTDN